MSAILIRGRKAPSCCASCNSELAAAVDCIYTKRLILPEEHDMRTGRHPDCPIIPVSDLLDYAKSLDFYYIPEISGYIAKRDALAILFECRNIDFDGYHEAEMKIEAFPDASVEGTQIWHPVGLPPAESGRYNVLCNEWGGWKSRTVSFLAGEKIWQDDSGRDITEYVVFWKDFPEHPKEEKGHV